MRLAMMLPLGLFAVILGAVGVKLVALARRTRALPELALGSGILLMGFLGIPLAALGRVPATVGTPLGHASFGVGVVIAMAGLVLLYVFNWRTFRPGSAWARGFVGAAAVVALGTGFGIAWQGAQADTLPAILARTRPWVFAIMSLTALQFAWSATESVHYQRLMRRRLAIGLADPVVANRFLLWALASGTCALLCVGLLICVRVGMAILVDPVPLHLVALTGIVSSVSCFLTFFPPEAYQRFLRGKA